MLAHFLVSAGQQGALGILASQLGSYIGQQGNAQTAPLILPKYWPGCCSRASEWSARPDSKEEGWDPQLPLLLGLV